MVYKMQYIIVILMLQYYYNHVGKEVGGPAPESSSKLLPSTGNQCRSADSQKLLREGH